MPQTHTYQGDKRQFSFPYLIVVDFVLDSSDRVSVPGVAEVLHQSVAGQVELGQRDEAITDAGLFTNPFFGRNLKPNLVYFTRLEKTKIQDYCAHILR
jgi:hypothetical protein